MRKRRTQTIFPSLKDIEKEKVIYVSFVSKDNGDEVVAYGKIKNDVFARRCSKYYKNDAIRACFNSLYVVDKKGVNFLYNVQMKGGSNGGTPIKLLEEISYPIVYQN